MKPFKNLIISQAVKSRHIVLYIRVCTDMAGRTAHVGRPQKHQGGWESANSRIYWSTETLALWQRLQSECEFPSDNTVAVFLLERNKTLTELQATLENR